MARRENKTTLMDSLNSESVQRLHKAFTDGMDLLILNTNGTNPSFRKQELEEVGEPLARYVWQALRASAEYMPHPYRDFPYRATLSITQILRQAYKGNGDNWTPSPSILNSITRLLRGNGLLKTTGNGQHIHLAPEWGGDAPLRWVQHKEKFDEVVERRIEEEATKTPPPVVTRDLRAIKQPMDFTPDALKKWVVAFVPAALKVQEERDELKAKVEALEARLSLLEADKEQEGWNEVGDAIKEAFTTPDSA